ncbi:MAG: hypothetical protein ABW208_27220 [Pyrinomonadaceae bacterium]
MSHPNLSQITASAAAPRGERGAALTMAMLIVALVAVMSIAVLSVVKHEARVAGGDLQHTRTFYAASAGLEKMTHDFSDLFRRTAKPTSTEMCEIADDPPEELVEEEGFTFQQTLKRNNTLLNTLKAQNGGKSPRTKIPNGPFAEMYAALEPYHLTSAVTHTATKTQVRLEREVNNYMIPLFQFATFSDGDLEFWPEPPMTFIGRVHANGNIYFGGDITFYDRVTTAGEAVRNVLRNNATNNTLVGGAYDSDPRFINPSAPTTVARMTVGSVTGGPNMTQPRADGRGNYPGSPTGTNNATWATTSVNPLNGVNNQFGVFLKTASTGARKLLLPLQIDGRAPAEIIKRSMSDDNTVMSQSRYHSKAEVRIIIDDEAAGPANVAGIPAGRGVLLSNWVPSELNGGNALRVVGDGGGYLNTTDWLQGASALNRKALTVRGVKNYVPTVNGAPNPNPNTGGRNATSADLTSAANSAINKTSNGAFVPPGAGLRGRILIEIVRPDGTTLDVTQTILSMGVTVGEPNAIVHLQRPLWAAFMQGSRDRTSATARNYLTYFMDNSVADRRALADGEMKITSAAGLTMNAAGFINTAENNLDDDPHTAGAPFQPTTMTRDDKLPDPATCTPQPGCRLNQIVPINVYNVREGHITDSLTTTNVYARGITSVVELNMRNLARWLDGVYDTNLLSNTPAVSTNIASPDGWIIYVSDRRGDRVKQERNSLGSTVNTTNGFVDNEDVYNYPGTAGGTPNPGEDVIDFGFDVAFNRDKEGSLQRDLLELPDPGTGITTTALTAPTGYADTTKYGRALGVGAWLTSNQTTAGTAGYHFRRAVRLFNGEDLKLSGAADKLSETKGITVATENMVYIWGNYNTTGITCQPASGSTENDTTKPCWYTGDQVPASIAADAFFPLSKTWFDSVSAMYPEGGNSRIADASNAGAPLGSSAIAVGQETSVRAGIIAGTTLSAMVGTPAATTPLVWLNGGVHNFPRFLETWGVSGGAWEKRWNYTGSFIILYNSTQAVGPWSVTSSVNYSPPRRNWAFDVTLTDPNRLPPGTPQFQFVQATGFRETPFNNTVTTDPCS